MTIRPIRNEAAYDEALGEIDRLMGATPGTPESDKLEILVTLVERYESQRGTGYDARNPQAARETPTRRGVQEPLREQAHRGGHAARCPPGPCRQSRLLHARTAPRQLRHRAPETTSSRLVGYVPRHRYLLIELQALDASVLPPENVLSMIARLEQARSLARLEELVESLVNWLERAGEPNLLHVFGAWIELVLEQRTGMAEGTPEPDFSREE